jgi:hypothetical protein
MGLWLFLGKRFETNPPTPINNAILPYQSLYDLDTTYQDILQICNKWRQWNRPNSSWLQILHLDRIPAANGSKQLYSQEYLLEVMDIDAAMCLKGTGKY